MTNEFEDSPLEVRIPVRYFDMLMDGEITGSMLLTMGMLYRWSNWGNGKVKKVSASGLATATADSFHKNTYQDALQRWEQMGEIERHMTLGSHKSYPVTIHNYRKRLEVRDKVTKDLVWKTFTINKWKTVTYKEFQDGLRAEALDGAPTEGVAEGVDEGVDEAPAEGVERTCISEHEPASDLQEDLQEDLQNKHQQQQGKGRAEAAVPSGGNSKPKAEEPTPEPEVKTPVEPDVPAEQVSPSPVQTEAEIPVEPVSPPCSITDISACSYNRVLAGWLGMWLGYPPKSVARKWEQDLDKMDTLLSSYAPELVLSDILDWMVFSEDEKAAKFREKIQAAKFSHTGLMLKLFTGADNSIVDSYYLWLSQQKDITLEDNLKDLLADNEPYSRYDGDKLRPYRFKESKLRPPCWYVLMTKEEKPEAPGWYPVPVDIAVGLDLPFPLDGTPQDELTKADLDYRKSATDPEIASRTEGGEVVTP